MGFTVVLSIFGMVGTLLVGILAGFPVSDLAPSPSQENAVTGEIFGDSSVHQGATKLAGVYTSVIDELISFQRAPDYQRAESRRQQLTEYASSAADSLDDFSSMLEGKLHGLTAGSGAQEG